jgi:hypothetical protein
MLKITQLYIWAFLLLNSVPATVNAQDKNGFDLAGSLIPVDEIHQGGPPRDGIPALEQPEFIPGNQSRIMENDDRILGLVMDGVPRAYPIYIMNWHEVVNERSESGLYVVTYCPLCGTGMAFSAQVEGAELTFGVSGLLYNSDVLLFDRQTSSLWSQIRSEAVTGVQKGTQLRMLPMRNTTWGQWIARNPDTLVLSTNTGYSRDYSTDPYAGYDQDRSLYFPVSDSSRRYHPKESTLGVEVDGVFRAYPYSELDANGSEVFTDIVNGRQLTIEWHEQSRTASVKDGETEYPVVTGYRLLVCLVCLSS